jgi:peptide/nickel transport system ATP-binding protein
MGSATVPAALMHGPPPPTASDARFLQVEDLTVKFATGKGLLVAVDDVSFGLRAGGRLGVVGESGSGKTVTVSAVMGIFAAAATMTGRVVFGGRDVLSMSESELRSLRGLEIALVPQDPTAALSPVRRIGAQMVETLRAHRDIGREAASQLALEALASVKVPSPERQLSAYPFELSGGMLQRVCIAMALLCEPKLLIADEATTSLDVSVQASILELLDQVASEHGMALIIVSHDMSVVAGLCDTAAVMYSGRIVEFGPIGPLFSAPRHPYTAALLECRPSIDHNSRQRLLTSIPGQQEAGGDDRNFCAFAPRCRFVIDRCTTERPALAPVASDLEHLAACWRADEPVSFFRPAQTAAGGLLSNRKRSDDPILEAREVRVQYSVRPPGVFRAAHVTAVDGVSFDVTPGGTLGLVGESGCGKSTVGRAVLGLQRLAGGSVQFAGYDLGRLDRATMRVLRRRMQLVVQSSFHSFDPRVPVGEALTEAARLGPDGRANTAACVGDLLDLVELPRRIVRAMPAELSGGQRQRASIARALATRPDFIVADEPTSALDVSVRAGIINLLRRLQHDTGVSYLFISHDLAAVRSMSDDVAVMYLGKIVEKGSADAVFERPAHPYTRALLDAVPALGEKGTERPKAIPGEVPSLLNPPTGCPFHPRCPRATDQCREACPSLATIAHAHEVACIHPLRAREEELV